MSRMVVDPWKKKNAQATKTINSIFNAGSKAYKVMNKKETKAERLRREREEQKAREEWEKMSPQERKDAETKGCLVLGVVAFVFVVILLMLFK